MGTAPSCLVSGPGVIRQGIVVQSESSIKEVAGMEECSSVMWGARKSLALKEFTKNKKQ